MIHLLHAFNPGPYTGTGNNTYLITGPEPVLIDAGVGDPRHLEQLADALDGRPLARVVVTHGHPDHASGAPAIAARWPRARFFKMPWAEIDARYVVEWRPIVDNDVIHAGEGRWRVIHTPGHAPDHVCLFDPENRTIFGGDLLVAHGTVVIPASKGGSLTEYLQSLERILALDPMRVLPAHGPQIEKPADLIRRYLVHRRQREDQILGVLERGPRTVTVLVELVYVDLSPELIGAASESVLAHLLKLEAEGRVSRDADEWRVIGG